ncbi:hypothetical protein OROGR_005635 [Orobanche gracilis]
MDSSLIRIRAMGEFPTPLLLKDHLLDDMSSCSSNGFKSFPRIRSQCCTTVRFLHDYDRSKRKQQKKYLNFNKKTSRSALSAFRRRIITAMKRLPFSAAKSPERKKLKSSFFARSFSRKILEKSCGFWKTRPGKKEIGRWKSFDQLMKEEPEMSVRDSKGSNSWSGGNFTVSSDSKSSLEVNLNLPDGIKDVVENGVDVAENGGVSTNSSTSSGSDNTNAPIHTTKKQWSSEHEKEQFSPMSVLDCPFGDEDEVSSPFQHTLARMIGTKTGLVKEIPRFECLAKLEPVNLAKLFALQLENSDNESSGFPPPHPPPSLDQKSTSDIEEEENEAERMALELLGRMKANYSQSSGLKLSEEKLLMDFFREKLSDKCANTKKRRVVSSFEKEILGEAEDWADGQNRHEVFIEWEIMKNRQAYVEDMDERGEWRTLDQESEGVSLELENAVFVELMNEVLLEILN